MPANSYYNHTSGQPVALSRGSSQAIREEFSAIEAAFAEVEEAISGINASSDFGTIYQGAKTVDPLLRNNGDALQPGDLYFNVGDAANPVLKAYSTSGWAALPTSLAAMLKSGGTFTGPIGGTTAAFTGNVSAAGFSGVGSSLTGFTAAQITTALQYTPANKAGDTFTGAINGTSATFTGTVSGAVVQQTSDERKKKSWSKLPADFISRLASIKKAGLFKWKKGNRPGVGVGAQSLEAILPEAVHEDEKGVKHVEYGAAALVACVELARAVEQLRRDIEALK